MSIIGLDNVTAKEHAAIGIRDGQRVAACAVRGADPTFEIGTPDAIGLVRSQKWLKPGTGASAAFTLGHQPIPAQNPASSAYCRPFTNYFRRFLRARKEAWPDPRWDAPV